VLHQRDISHSKETFLRNTLTQHLRNTCDQGVASRLTTIDQTDSYRKETAMNTTTVSIRIQAANQSDAEQAQGWLEQQLGSAIHLTAPQVGQEQGVWFVHGTLQMEATPAPQRFWMGDDDLSDPVIGSWERLTMLLIQATFSETAYPGWIVAQDPRTKAMIACRRRDEAWWRVLTGSDEFEQRVGKSAVQRFGRSWVDQGWVTPGKERTTWANRMPNGENARVVHIPLKALAEWAGGGEDEEHSEGNPTA
jgi:hypothetical protein